MALHGKHARDPREARSSDLASPDASVRAQGRHAHERIERSRAPKHARQPEAQTVEEPASEPQDEAPSVARSTLLMSIATLGSRVTGLARTWVMAFALGNTVITSAYQVANNMPNVIYELVAGGLLGAAFVPVYLLQKKQRTDDGGSEFASTVLNLAIIVLGILSLLATVFAPAVISTQTFTLDSGAEVSTQATFFFRIFACQIVFYGIGGVVTGILNANRVYFLPSLAPALNNIVVIASLLAYLPLSAANESLALLVLAVGTTLGVVIQFCIQLPALAKAGFHYRPRINLHDPALKEALKIAVPTFLYIIGTMVAFSCRNAFSLEAADNGPSTLIYAWTWYQLPYGVVAVSLSRALFTEMSDDAARGDNKSLRRHIESGISGTLLLIIPLAGVMGSLATPLMQLFQAGAFSAEDASFVGSILALWVVSMPFYSVLMYLYNAYASIRKFMVFAVVSTLLVILQVVLYATLCLPGALGLSGVPVADLVYYGGCCLLLLVMLQRYVGSIGIRSILSKSLRVLLATFIGIALSLLVQALLPFDGSSMLTGLITILVCGILSVLVIFLLCAVLRVPEMQLITSRLRRKVR